MPDNVLAFLAALGVALLVTPVVIAFARRTGALDKPDARKVHVRPIPRIGGIGIYAAFMVSILIQLTFVDLSAEYMMSLIGLMTGGTIIVAIGIIDDYCDLPAKVKLLGQIAAAAVVVIGFDVRIDVITDPLGDYIYLEFLAIPATIFWIVGLTNTVNLIDGLDGLAAGISSIAAVTIFLVAMEEGIPTVAMVTIALAGAAVGFLYYNFNPARIFMGDTGSMFLGFMLAGISVVGAVKSAATIALIVPILDTTFAIVRRARNHRPIFKPDKGHLHHRLLAHGFSQKQAVLLMYVVSALFGLCALALTAVSMQAATLIILIVAAAVFVGARKLGILGMDAPQK